jgi:hypothetical protein
MPVTAEMSVPKATVNEDDLAPCWEHDIWFPGQINGMQSISNSGRT